MARFCTECGKENEDGVAFCTGCGAAAPATARSIPIQAAPVAPPPQAAQVTPPPQAVPIATATLEQPGVSVPRNSDGLPPKGKYGVVGTGTYFALMFLFAIPIIGGLICLIMSFAPKNENTKHFARAMLIWIIIGIILSVAGFFVFRWLGGMITDYINAELSGQFGDLQDLAEQLKQFENSGLTLPTN